jgi:hypothetical protein
MVDFLPDDGQEVMLVVLKFLDEMAIYFIDYYVDPVEIGCDSFLIRELA